MPSFFNFQTGSESRGPATDSSPLLGRFRAVPDVQRIGRRNSYRNSLLGSFTAGRGFGVFGNGGGDDSDDGDSIETEDMGALRRWGRTQRDLWLEPKQAAVARLVDKWWTRWVVLVFLPAALVCEPGFVWVTRRLTVRRQSLGVQYRSQNTIYRMTMEYHSK